MDKVWEISPQINKELKNKFPDIDPVVLQLLFNRGLKTKKDMKSFLSPDYKSGLHSPFLFNDMKRVVKRIYKAQKNNEKVVICTDSDTDGATSGALMFKVLDKIGINDLDIYTADRDKEGYGLNEKMIDKFIKQKISLIITCDSGITNFSEIKKAKKAGIDTIITDHHQEPEKLPPAFAILNPKVSDEDYPFKYLAGVGVAFKLAQALLSDERFKVENKKAFEKWLLDLVAIGTIVDHMPIIEENRNLVYFGMIVLNKTHNCGLKKLFQNVNLDKGHIKAQDVVYRIGPRLNVPGRIGHPDESLKLLLSGDSLKARKKVKRLERLNRKRRSLVKKNVRKITKRLGKSPEDKIIVVEEKLKSGLLGLLAMRLVEYYNRPAIVLSHKKDKIKGSGRSPDNFNFLKALKNINQKYFFNIGGHKQALGFTLKPDFLEKFKKSLKNKEDLLNKQEKPKLNIDAKINLEQINWNLVDQIGELKPFGVKNPEPLFVTKNLHLSSFKKVGKNGNHNRLLVKDHQNGDFGKMIYFGSSQIMKDYNNGDKVDVVFKLGTNVWNGRKEIQMTVADIKKA